MGFDIGILDFIQLYLRCDFLDTVMPLITMLGNGGILWILVCLVLLISPKTRKIGLVVMLALILEALCCNVILKPLIARVRPFDVNTAVQLLISRPRDFSFPSGHTGASFAVVGALYFSKHRLWIPSLIISILIAFSRLYLYVHYPTDVLAGALIGILAGWLGWVIAQRIERRSQGHHSEAL